MNIMYCVIAEYKTDEVRIISPILTYKDAYQIFETHKQDQQVIKIAIAELTVAFGHAGLLPKTSRTVGVF